MDDLNNDECSREHCALFVGECVAPESRDSEDDDLFEEVAEHTQAVGEPKPAGTNSMAALTKSTADKQVGKNSPSDPNAALVLPAVDPSTLIGHIEEWASDNDLSLNSDLFKELASVYGDIQAGREKINGIGSVLQEITDKIAHFSLLSEQSSRELAAAKPQSADGTGTLHTRVDTLHTRVNACMQSLKRYRQEQQAKFKRERERDIESPGLPPDHVERLLALEKQTDEMCRVLAKLLAGADKKPLQGQNDKLAASNKELMAINRRLREDVLVLKGSNHDLRKDVAVLKGSNFELRKDVTVLKTSNERLQEVVAGHESSGNKLRSELDSLRYSQSQLRRDIASLSELTRSVVRRRSSKKE